MAHGRIQIQAQSEAKAISRPIGSWSACGAKNVLQQLTWERALGEAERAERVGEGAQYCTGHCGRCVTEYPYLRTARGWQPA